MKLVCAAILRSELANLQEDSRLDRVGQGVQEVLDLVRLLPELVERAWVVRSAIVPSSVTEGALVSQVVARCAPNLRHNCGREQKRGAGCECKEWRWVGGYDVVKLFRERTGVAAKKLALSP